MPKPTLFISYSKFCKWYFDEETIDDAINELIRSRKITMNEILQEVMYIPKKLVINQDDLINNTIDVHDEIDEPNEFYNLKFKGE